ncbi:MAG: hypothetical protein QW757_05390 [Candidatus Woesearchaeota archaeon]
MGFLKFLKDFKSLFYEDIVRRKKTTPFLIFIFLLASFFISRVFVLYFPGRSLFIKDYHIHHFFFGLIFLCVAGYIALVSNKISLHRLSAVLYGIGLGMMLDEIGLFLTCGTYTMECDYWARVTYDVFIIVVSLFLAIIYFEPFWKRVGKSIRKILNKIFKF